MGGAAEWVERYCGGGQPGVRTATGCARGCEVGGGEGGGVCLRIVWSCELLGWAGESAGNELLSTLPVETGTCHSSLTAVGTYFSIEIASPLRVGG